MDELRRTLARFVKSRDWEQFHSPKNLSMALAGEAGEILEIFQWLTQAESRALPKEKRAMLADEIGDVMIYLTMLADKFGIDPVTAAKRKTRKNMKKYPAAKTKGSRAKYTELK